MAFETILTALDGSRISLGALDTAIELAKRLHAGLHACYVIDYVTLPAPLGSLAQAPEDAPDLLRGEGEHAIRVARQHAKAAQIDLHTHLLHGRPVDTILACAQQLQASLIVMGTHGRTGIARAFVGSIAEGVLRRSRIPVLTTHRSSE